MTIALAITAQAAPALAEPAACQLLIEGSPRTAGTVTPNAGIHHFTANSVVSLTAEPQPGYQFAYWLGDVSEPTAQRTTVRVDANKLIVAVFHPASREPVEEQLLLGGGGDGRLIPSSMDLTAPSWALAGATRARTLTPPAVRPEIVTPEPATIVLLGVGLLYLRRCAY